MPTHARGSREPETAWDWLRQLANEPWVQRLTAAARFRLGLLCRELMLCADWETFEAWPTWARLITITGWCRSSVARYLQQLRIEGWLLHVERGSTPNFRPMGMSLRGNRAAVYALRIPRKPGELRPEEQPAVDVDSAARVIAEAESVLAAAAERIANEAAPATRPAQAPVVDVVAVARSLVTNPQVTSAGEESWTPTGLLQVFTLSELVVLSRASAFFHNSSAQPHLSSNQVQRTSNPQPSDASWSGSDEALRARTDEEQGRVFAGRVPGTRAEMYAAACELRAAVPVFGRLSAKKVRSLCKPYWRAGWTCDDVVFALRWTPASWTPRTSTAVEQIASPSAWIAARLQAWRHPSSGRILPGQTDAERAQESARQHVLARFGHQGALALPAKARQLTAEHLLARARKVAGQAAELITTSIVTRTRTGTPSDGCHEPAPRPDAARQAVLEQARAIQRGKKAAPVGATPAVDRRWTPDAPVVPDRELTAEERLKLARERAAYDRIITRRY